jgi:hypothetical protein
MIISSVFLIGVKFLQNVENKILKGNIQLKIPFSGKKNILPNSLKN